MKISLYARVSTEDKGQDPETQMDIIRDIAKKRGFEIEGEYIDYASGKDANRPQWKLVTNKVINGETDGIMALRLDRVMRSVIHLCDTMELMRKYNAKLIFSDLEYDPENPNSELQINLMSAIAQWERQIIAKRTSEGMRHRKSKGAVFGRKQRDIPIHTIALMKMRGMGWNTIAKELDIPRTTILGRKEDIESEIAKIEGMSDRVGSVEQVSEREGVE